MNAIVLNSYTSVGNWSHTFFAKIGNAINKIGYHRAATELARIGYTEQARKCLEQYNSL
jgi:hypothetical protein